MKPDALCSLGVQSWRDKGCLLLLNRGPLGNSLPLQKGFMRRRGVAWPDYLPEDTQLQGTAFLLACQKHPGLQLPAVLKLLLQREAPMHPDGWSLVLPANSFVERFHHSFFYYPMGWKNKRWEKQMEPGPCVTFPDQKPSDLSRSLQKMDPTAF